MLLMSTLTSGRRARSLHMYIAWPSAVVVYILHPCRLGLEPDLSLTVLLSLQALRSRAVENIFTVERQYFSIRVAYFSEGDLHGLNAVRIPRFKSRCAVVRSIK